MARRSQVVLNKDATRDGGRARACTRTPAADSYSCIKRPFFFLHNCQCAGAIWTRLAFAHKHAYTTSPSYTHTHTHWGDKRLSGKTSGVVKVLRFSFSSKSLGAQAHLCACMDNGQKPMPATTIPKSALAHFLLRTEPRKSQLRPF